MIINRNFIKKSNKNTIEVTRMENTGVYDYRVVIEDEFWNNFKSGNTTLSFWFAPKEPLEKDRNFVVHYSDAPYYQFGTIHYPAGTNEPKFYKFTLVTKNIPETYKTLSWFIRFKEYDLGKTFYLTQSKLEVSNGNSFYIPSKTDLEPSKQAIYLAGGGVFQEVYPL
ncbi:hypothetical protein [Anaerococcus marasmi]|uniref:hypothetical protein n=1 Tax=Anaerococcus marasmi TaxID=2057797 RepID=UPI000CFA7DEB|nr:hypothetical protein [Anaerococcus marasmi]